MHKIKRIAGKSKTGSSFGHVALKIWILLTYLSFNQISKAQMKLRRSPPTSNLEAINLFTNRVLPRSSNSKSAFFSFFSSSSSSSLFSQNSLSRVARFRVAAAFSLFYERGHRSLRENRAPNPVISLSSLSGPVWSNRDPQLSLADSPSSHGETCQTSSLSTPPWPSSLSKIGIWDGKTLSYPISLSIQSGPRLSHIGSFLKSRDMNPKRVKNSWPTLPPAKHPN